MKKRIAGWIIGVLLFNAAAFLIMLQLPPVGGLAWAAAMGALVAWWHLRPHPGRRSLHALLRLRAPRAPTGWVLRACALSLVILFGVVGLVHRFGYDLEDESGPFWEQVAAYQETLAGAAAVMLLAALIVPVLEELVFRGRVQRTLERAYGAPSAIISASLLFMLAHVGGPHWSVLFIPLVLGLSAGTAVFLSQSIWPGIAIHALWNGLTPFTAGAVTELADVNAHALVAVSVGAILLGVFGWRRLTAELPRSLSRADPA